MKVILNDSMDQFRTSSTAVEIHKVNSISPVDVEKKLSAGIRQNGKKTLAPK